MNGEISVKGVLSIERPRPRGVEGSEMQSIQMICPFDSEEYCGDHCPLFREPMPHYTSGITTKGGIVAPEPTGKQLLQLCRGTLFFDKFKDHRMNKIDWPGPDSQGGR